MPFVLDCSVAMDWLFADTPSSYSDRVRQLAEAEVIYVPAIWPLEVASVLCKLRRRGIVTADSVDRFLLLINSLRIKQESVTGPDGIGEVYMLAIQYALSAYDTTYIELARQKNIKLATRDAAMMRVATVAGVALVAA